MDGRLPRYQRLRDEIAERIGRHEWSPGEAIPTEAELAHSHGIAVGTVRKAIDALVGEGVIERQQGRGTFVRRPNFDHSLFRFFRHRGGGEGGLIPESRILERTACQAVPETVVAMLRLNRPHKALRLFRLRLSGGIPLLREEIWLPFSRFAPLLEAEEADIGPLLYPAYERLCGEIVARAEETLTVGQADAADQRHLGVEPGTPVVMIDRLAYGFDGHPLEWRRSHGLADKFRYQVEIR